MQRWGRREFKVVVERERERERERWGKEKRVEKLNMGCWETIGWVRKKRISNANKNKKNMFLLLFVGCLALVGYLIPNLVNTNAVFSKQQSYRYCCMDALQGRTLTKRMEKKLNGNNTRMLRAILNKSWERWTIEKRSGRGSWRSALAARHDNYDEIIWCESK